MNFAFLVHPLSEETKQLVELDSSGGLKNAFGQDMLSFCGQLHQSVAKAMRSKGLDLPDRVRVVDEVADLVSAQGARADGRLYEIPMDALAILDDPTQAMEYMQEAVNLAADWGEDRGIGFDDGDRWRARHLSRRAFAHPGDHGQQPDGLRGH